MSLRKIGVGATGRVGAAPGSVPGAPGTAPGAPGTVGTVAGIFTPTTRFSIWASEVIVPIVETGMFVPSVAIWPDGSVRLLAVRTPVT